MNTPKVFVSVLSVVFIAALSLIIAKPAAADDIARVVISDDATGGECTTVGKWNASTKTCKLTEDIDLRDTAFEYAILIEGDGITLLCNGHSITADGAIVGILSDEVSDVTIKDCTVEGFHYGIYLLGGGYNTVKNNTVAYNSFYGISLYGSDYNTASDNIASNNYIGIRHYYSNNNTLNNNSANSNRYVGIYFSNSDSNSLNNNQANDNSAISGPAAGIILNTSNSNTVNNNTANNNSGVTFAVGIQLQILSNNNTVNNNTANNNSASTGDGVGISVIANSDSNVVNSNTADNNSSYGHFLEDSTSMDNTFHHDECSDNGIVGSDPTGLCSGR